MQTLSNSQSRVEEVDAVLGTADEPALILLMFETALSLSVQTGKEKSQ